MTVQRLRRSIAEKANQLNALKKIGKIRIEILHRRSSKLTRFDRAKNKLIIEYLPNSSS